MAKFNVGNLLEEARAVLLVDDSGNILGMASKPLQVTGEVTLVAGDEEDILTDEISGALVMMDLAHHEVHEGYFFTTSHYWGSVTNTGTFIILLRTGARYDHIAWNVACGGDCEVEVIAEPTVTNQGTSIAIYNMNRPSTIAPLTAAWHTPTISGGNILEHYALPGGKGVQAAGGMARSGSEWIMKPNTYYAIRGTNRSGNTQIASAVVQWYGEATNG